MTNSPMNARRLPILMVAGIIVGGLTSVASLAALALLAWEKVHAGHGLGPYRTHWLVEFNWIGFLIFLAAMGVALTVGLFFRLRDWYEFKELERKYGQTRDG